MIISAILVALGVVLVLAALVGTIYLVIFRRPLPRLSGDLVTGVAADVEIVRDEDGVPHVVAASRRDAAFAVGFLHGQERLWQMELQRRIASGRLSEVMGERALGADRLMRRLGLMRVSQAEWHVTHATGELRPLLEAYAAGVNAARNDRALPAEFTILRHRPEPWTPEDSLAVGRFLSFGQAGNWEAQLVRARLLKELGPTVMAALDPGYPGDSPMLAATSGAAEVAGASAGALLQEIDEAREIMALSTWAGMSNSWTVHGSRTETGRPILATDPHSVMSIPSPWYQVHLTTPEDELVGLTFCGSPFVLAGHNRHIAWGLVNSGASIQGLYVERLNPNNPMQFLDAGEWQDAVRFREIIKVRGAKPVVEDVLVTRRGPIISPAIPGNHPPLSLRWVGHDAEVDSHGWVMRLNRAHDWKTFRAAVASMASPSLIFTYADVEGNIGYRMSGFVPVRGSGQGRLPARGWEPADDWRGFVAFEDMPEALNPPEGYVVAANNPVATGVGSDPIVFEASNGYRARRLEDLVGANGRMTVAASVDYQADVMSLPGEALRLLVLDRLRPDPAPGTSDGVASSPVDDLGLGLAVLEEWDGRLDAASAGGLLYERLLDRLLAAVIGDRVPEAARRYLLGGSVLDLFPQGPFNTRLVPVLLDLLAAGRVAPEGEPDAETRDRVLAQALAEAVAECRRQQSSDPATWRWGKAHQVRFDHPLAAAVRPLARILSRGPFAGSGDNDTVHLSWRGSSSGILSPVTSAFWRAVYDISDWTASVGTYAPGQSGHPASEHYADLIDGWLDGRPRTLLFGAQPKQGQRLVLRAEPGAVPGTAPDEGD